MAIRFDGKVALVTGAGSGIGQACAMALAREGARVVVSDVAAKEGEETVRMIRQAGGEALFIRADVSKASDVAGMIAGTVDAYGRLDCAVNNAGIGGVGGTIDQIKEESWDQVIAVNLKGIFLCMKYEIPQMLKAGGGVIVNMSSVGGLAGVAGNAPYIASKHGIIGLTKTAALEFAESGIRVNAVCPGTIRTPLVQRAIKANPDFEKSKRALHPMGRLGEPGEIAEAVLWLCSEAASFVTGHALVADGGRLAA